ncbi:MAG: YncE family protein [Vicinamibacterales bacterium]
MRVSRFWFQSLAVGAAVAALCLPLGAQGRPKPLVPSPGTGTMYVGVFPDHFQVIDEATGTITGKVPFTAGMPRRTALAKDRTRFYTVEAQMEKVEIIEIATRKSLDTFSLSQGNRRVRIKTLEPDPLHRFVMLVVRPVIKHVDRWEIEPSALIKYDLASHAITGTLPWPNGEERENATMQFSPDGKLLYLFSEQDVLIYDTTSLAQVDRWELSKPVEEGYGAFEFGQIDAANDEPGYYTAIFQVQDPVQKRRMMGIGRVNLAAKKVDFYTLGPAQQVGFSMAPGRKVAYGLFNDIGHYEFWKFDLEGRRVAARVPFAGRPRMSLKVSTSGKVLYIYNAGDTIDLYEADTFKYMRTINLGGDVTSDLFVIPGPAAKAARTN